MTTCYYQIRLSDGVELRTRPTVTATTATTAYGRVAGRAGSITAADILVGDRYLLTAVSMCAACEQVGNRGYADASAHRILPDLSALTLDSRLRPIVAGDWNLAEGFFVWAAAIGLIDVDA